VYDGMVKSSRGVGADLCSASDTLSQVGALMKSVLE
jgi:hypothetical protein